MDEISNLLQEMNDSRYWYLDGIREQLNLKTKGLFKECRLFHVEQLIYEPSQYYLSAFEHILGTVRTEGILFLALMIKTKNTLDFYYGLMPETEKKKKETKDAAELFEAEFEAVFPEGELTPVRQKETEEILKYAESFSYAATLEGIPGIPKQAKECLGESEFSRMLNKERYAVILLAKPLEKRNTREIEGDIQFVYNSLFSFVSQTKSFEETDVCTTSGTVHVAGTDGSSFNSSQPIVSKDKKEEEKEGPHGHKSCSCNTGQNLNNSLSKTVIHTSRCSRMSQATIGAFGLKAWLDFVGNTLSDRIQYGKVNGMYLYRLMLFTECTKDMRKLEMLLKRNCYGDRNTFIPVKLAWHNKDKGVGFFCCSKTDTITKERKIRNAFSQMIDVNGNDSGFWITGRELGSLLAFPQIQKKKRRQELEDTDPVLILGDCNSGKTESAMELIKKRDCPFLAIEPLGDTFRNFTNDGIQPAVFTVYGDNIPFAINPFWCYPGETKKEHISMLLICFSLGYHLPERLLLLLEKAMYLCYEGKKEGKYPVLSEVLAQTELLIKMNCPPNDAAFYHEMIDETIGALIRNGKEKVYDVQAGINLLKWIDTPVVIELRKITDANEKSFLMGLLVFISGFVSRYKRQAGRNFSHLIVAEEIHRFFSPEKQQQQTYANRFQSGIDFLKLSIMEGEHYIFIEQSPLLVAEAFYAVCSTIITHRISSNRSKNFLSERSSLSKEQYQMLSDMEKGKKIILN